MDVKTSPPPQEPAKPETAAIDESPAQPSAPAAAPTGNMAPSKSSNTAIVAIVMAVVVALGLGGIGVMAYMNTKKAIEPAPQSTVVSPTPKVSSGDVNKTYDDMNASLKTIDDAQDFGANDLSDTTLGIQ